MFNHPFREVGGEDLLIQEARAKRGEISAARPKKVRAVLEGVSTRYVGYNTQVTLSVTSFGAATQHGGARTARVVTSATAFGKSATTWRNLQDKEAERRTKVQQTLGIRVLRPFEVKPSGAGSCFISVIPPSALRCPSSVR